MNRFLLFLVTTAPVHFTVPPPDATFQVPRAPITFAVATTFKVNMTDLSDCRCGPSCNCGKGSSCDCVAEYTTATVAEAIRQNKPLYVFVNRATEPVEGAMICKADVYRGSSEPAVIRLYPRDGKLWERMASPPVQQIPLSFQRGPMFFGDCGPSG